MTYTYKVRLTRRCSGAAEARFEWVLVRPFGGPLNAGVRWLALASSSPVRIKL